MKKIIFSFVLSILIFVLWIVVDKHWQKLELLFSPKQSKDISSQAQNRKQRRAEIYNTLSFETLGAARFYESTPEEIAEEQAFEAEQIELARQLLLDLDIEKRMAGLEQLTAFPSSKSEQFMVDILKNDMSEEIRAAAADYLSYIEEPSLTTQNALIQALNDANEDVRNNALNTVLSYIHSLEEDKASAKRIINLLKRQAENKQLSSDIRETIKEYLIDQFEN